MPRRKENPEIRQEFTCPNSACRLVFSKPLKVKNLGVENSEIYDACPRCLTAITIEEGPPMAEAKLEAGMTTNENVENTPSVEKKKTESRPGTHCSHRFGYLSERPKNDKIPDECVVCENIVKCMLKSITGETG